VHRPCPGYLRLAWGGPRCMRLMTPL
jgi:hypothetical protein